MSNDLPLKTLPEISISDDEMWDVVRNLFQLMTPNIWFRILPVDDNCDDICAGTGFDWDIILPVLYSLGLVRANVTSAVKTYEIVKKKWEHLRSTFGDARGLHFTPVKLKGKPTAYFVCVGKPKVNYCSTAGKESEKWVVSYPATHQHVSGSIEIVCVQDCVKCQERLWPKRL